MCGNKAISWDFSLEHCYSSHRLQNFDCWLPPSRNVNLPFLYLISQSLSPSIHFPVNVSVQTRISSALNLLFYRSTEGWMLGERESMMDKEEGPWGEEAPNWAGLWKSIKDIGVFSSQRQWGCGVRVGGKVMNISQRGGSNFWKWNLMKIASEASQ